jgi:hypothetical protein
LPLIFAYPVEAWIKYKGCEWNLNSLSEYLNGSMMQNLMKIKVNGTTVYHSLHHFKKIIMRNRSSHFVQYPSLQGLSEMIS